MPNYSRQDLDREQLTRLARLGAQARLEELQQEEAAIRQAFPDLVGSRRGRRPGRRGPGRPPRGAQASEIGTSRPRRRRRRRMSAAARKAVSERMRKYWAERRKKAGK